MHTSILGLKPTPANGTCPVFSNLPSSAIRSTHITGLTMLKSELLRALQTEIRRHTFDYFVENPPAMARGGPGVVVLGCPACRKRIESTRWPNSSITWPTTYCPPCWTSSPRPPIIKTMLPRIQPVNLPVSLFDDVDFIWELKHDGFRAVAYVDCGKCQALSPGRTSAINHFLASARCLPASAFSYSKRFAEKDLEGEAPGRAVRHHADHLVQNPQS